jgi:archaellum biogenesis protein FlaJ (TadC family)
MDWEKFLWAILIVMMILTLIPRAKMMFQQSRQAQPGDWSSAILPLLLVVGFVILLVVLVRR